MATDDHDRSVTFVLAGTSQHLTRSAVETRLVGIVPRPVETYAVQVNGVDWWSITKMDVLDHFDTLNDRRGWAATRVHVLYSLLMSFSNISANLAIGVVLLLAGRLLAGGSFSEIGRAHV